MKQIKCKSRLEACRTVGYLQDWLRTEENMKPLKKEPAARRGLQPVISQF